MRLGKITYRLLLIGVLFLLFSQCKNNKKEEPEPFAELRLTVPDLPSSVSNVEYFVFEKEQEFQNTLSSRNPSNFSFSGRLQDGKISIPQLPAGREYYIYVRYSDTTSFPGYSILYTNEESTFYIPKSQSESKINGVLKMKPQDGLVSFNASSELGMLTIKGSGILDSVANGTKTILLRKGTYQIQEKAKNIGACVWFKEFAIKPGAMVQVTQEPCSIGQVVFYTTSSANQNVKVYIGIGEYIGSITTIGAPPSCSDVGYPHATLVPGEYSYYAVPEDGASQCAWTGTFTITSGCTQVSLQACPN